MLSPAMRCQARVVEFRTALIPMSSRDRHDPGNPVASPAAASPQHSADSEAFKARAGRRAPCTVEPAAGHPHIPRLIIHPVRSNLDEGQETRRDARRAAPTMGLFEGGANALTSRSIDKNKRPRGPSRSGRKLLMDAERLGSSRPAGPHTELMASLTASSLGIVSRTRRSCTGLWHVSTGMATRPTAA